MGEEAKLQIIHSEEEEVQESVHNNGICSSVCAPVNWFKKLAMELHWSFVFSVVIVYGVSQGLGGAFSRISTEYYMKDVQKVQPSESQVYSGITSIPWIVKPLWGLLTDAVPILGYRRRPYFLFAGNICNAISFSLSFNADFRTFLDYLVCHTYGKEKPNFSVNLLGLVNVVLVYPVSILNSREKQQSSVHRLFSLAEKSTMVKAARLHHHVLLILYNTLLDFQANFVQSNLSAFGSAAVAIADVTVDACVAQNSGSHPSLQLICSLCALSSSPALGVYGLLSIPAGLVVLVGVLLKESRTHNFAYQQVNQNLPDAAKAMWSTLKCPEVWRPCLYMYLSFAVSVDIQEGMFYWATDSKGGPQFSKEYIGYISAVASIGSLLGAILYQYGLKDHSFRDLLFWTQLMFGLSGMLDLVLVLRLNLKLGIPDYFFMVMDASVSQMVGRLKWMPLLVLSSKLCPPGIEGTFFALLMSIDNTGLLTSTWGGGLLLHVFKITRTRFHNLWLAILIRNILRITPLLVLFLVPRSDPNSSILPDEVSDSKETTETPATQNENIELVALVHNMDTR
ncbi:hypothetical protein HAX54_023291 [Datura stramonium]|uniref:Folate-biopterin transporter 2 n=1 Tax=Datura stramonium TaxID=4076 RepID=A0ABS8S4U3_DATST|nr:hypothetical protein [Datura stramonium]